MAGKLSLKACFEAQGTKPASGRSSRSGRSVDGKAVSVVLWRDLFSDKGKSYKNVEPPEDWREQPGFSDLISNLMHASEHTGGVVSVIVAVATDVSAPTRSMADCFPQKDLKMQVAELDAETGAFRLQRVEA